MGLARRGNPAVLPGLSNTRRRGLLICLGVRPVPTSSNDVRRDYLTTEAAPLLGLGLAERGESIENRSSTGSLGYRGVGSLLRVPFRADDRGCLRLVRPVLLRVAGSLAGLYVS